MKWLLVNSFGLFENNFIHLKFSKNIKTLILLLFIVAAVSCTVQKRLYRKGYYVEKFFSQNHRQSLQKTNPQTTYTIDSNPACVTEKILNSPVERDTVALVSSHSTKIKSTNLHKSFVFFHYLPHPYIKNFSDTKTHSLKNTQCPVPSSPSKPLDPVTKSQLISIIFYLYQFMLCLNFFSFFYADPVSWFSSPGGGIFLFFISILLLFSFLSYFREKKRNYKAYNSYMSKTGMVLNMLLYEFLLYGIIFINILDQWVEMPYSVWFFVFNILVNTILLAIGIYILFFSDKKDKLAKESSIVEPNVNENPDLKKKIQLLRKIKFNIYMLSVLLIFSSIMFSAILTNPVSNAAALFITIMIALLLLLFLFNTFRNLWFIHHYSNKHEKLKN